jgi:hypothetical protein
MAYEFKGRIICDGCGASFESKTEHRATYVNNIGWDVKQQALRARWVFLSQGRYRVEKHFCPACADVPQVKAKVIARRPTNVLPI